MRARLERVGHSRLQSQGPDVVACFSLQLYENAKLSLSAARDEVERSGGKFFIRYLSVSFVSRVLSPQ